MTAGPPDSTSPAAPRSSFPTGSEPAPAVVADLHALLGPTAPSERAAPRRSRELAAQLLSRLAEIPGRSSRHAGTLAARIVTDDV
ncbi:MAG: hypothetical protein WCN81_16095, partial [Actinomycetes bacterium]